MLRASSRHRAYPIARGPRATAAATAASLDSDPQGPLQTRRQSCKDSVAKSAAALGSWLVEPWSERRTVLTCAAIGTAIGVFGGGGVDVHTFLGTAMGAGVGVVGAICSPIAPQHTGSTQQPPLATAETKERAEPREEEKK